MEMTSSDEKIVARAIKILMKELSAPGDEVIFFGTLNQTAVHPREIVKKALACNAASLVCYHNHPSRHSAPSEADRHLTTMLQSALQLVEVRLLDHIIVGGLETYSFAEHGDL
jgi:DNA repair protein RadC